MVREAERYRTDWARNNDDDRTTAGIIDDFALAQPAKREEKKNANG